MAGTEQTLNESISIRINALADYLKKYLDHKQNQVDYKFRAGRYSTYPHLVIKRGEKVLLREDIITYLHRVAGVQHVYLSSIPGKFVIKITIDKVFHRNGMFWFDEIMQDCEGVLKMVLPEGTAYKLEIASLYEGK